MYTRCRHFLENHKNCTNENRKISKKTSENLLKSSAFRLGASFGAPRGVQNRVPGRLEAPRGRPGPPKGGIFLHLVGIFFTPGPFWSVLGGLGDHSGSQKDALRHPKERLGCLLGTIFAKQITIKACVLCVFLSTRISVWFFFDSRLIFGPPDLHYTS